nr:CFF_HP1_G0040670.mRNA.1.CDS.1 [Saccharomyces cerevisiae]
MVVINKQLMVSADIAGVAKMSMIWKTKIISTVGAGRIGYRVLERLVAFNPKKLLYYDYQELPAEAINRLNEASKLFNGKVILFRVENWRIWLLSQMLLPSTVHCTRTQGVYSIKAYFPHERWCILGEYR